MAFPNIPPTLPPFEIGCQWNGMDWTGQYKPPDTVPDKDLRGIRGLGWTAVVYLGLVEWWARWDSNPRPKDYESSALTG